MDDQTAHFPSRSRSPDALRHGAGYPYSGQALKAVHASSEAETHLPVPEHIPGRPGRRLNPESLTGKLRALQVGQHFPSGYDDRNKFNTQLLRVSAQTGARFVTKKVDGQVIVWRAA